MISDKQLEANRQNALQSTGPKTAEGVEAVKLKALRHGLRLIQTVVPGKDPDAWEAHRAAVLEDVKPSKSARTGPGRTNSRKALATWPRGSLRG